MAVYDSAKFLRDIKSLKSIPAAVVLMGEEETFLSECLKSIQNRFLEFFGQKARDFDIEILRGEKDSAQKIVESCETLPLSAPSKLVVVHHFEKLAESAKSEIGGYLENPNPQTSLILSWNIRLNQSSLNHALAKTAGSIGALVKCWKIYEEKRPQWVAEEFSKSGKTASFKAAKLLAEEGGESLAELKSEIEKVNIYVGEKKNVEIEDVQTCLSFRRNRSIWDFVDHFEKGKMAEAGKILEDCFLEGEEPIKVLHLIARSLRKSSGALSQSQNLRLFNELKKCDLSLKTGEGMESGLFEKLLNSCLNLKAKRL